MTRNTNDQRSSSSSVQQPSSSSNEDASSTQQMNNNNSSFMMSFLGLDQLPKPLSYYLQPHFLLYVIPRYFITLFSHKIFIFFFGLYIDWRLRKTAFSVSIWRLFFHDWSKFTPIELLCYADNFFGEKNSGLPNGFPEAVVHHIQRQDHHAEHWWLPKEVIFPSNPNYRRDLMDRYVKQTDVLGIESNLCQDIHNRRAETRLLEKYGEESLVMKFGGFIARNSFLRSVFLNPLPDEGAVFLIKRMSDEAVVEMIVDWHAAEVAYAGNIPMPNKGEWMWPKMMSDNTGLHPVSDVVLHALLVFLGFEKEIGDAKVFKGKVITAKKWLQRGEKRNNTIAKVKSLFVSLGANFELYVECLDDLELEMVKK